MSKKIAIIIPARMASTRLPNKPLVDILGKTMIRRVYEKAIKSGVGEVFVACDCKEIFDEIVACNGKAIITDANLPSGTDRIYAALQQIDKEFDVVINLQGDLPNINENAIKSACQALLESDADIATIASKIKDFDEIDNVNIVKIAIAFCQEDLGRALYFSRAAIPYSKEKNGNYYHHIGIYAYKIEALKKFVSLKPSNLEIRESLEQLRALENNMKIAVKIVENHPLSVDTKQDLDKVIELIEKSGEL
jgi:3-deoxy-manno-octulosonate cytidylyltransferase (CMP-KDO synthetase)